MSEYIKLPPSPYSESQILYVFQHRGRQQAVWLHKIGAEGEFLRGTGYVWRCSCGANDASQGRELTAELLSEAWSHFDGHLEPAAIPLCGAMARWNRGGREPDLDVFLESEVRKILGLDPDPPPEIEVVHICGMCGQSFEISEDDPHWATGRGPICPTPPESDIATRREDLSDDQDPAAPRRGRS